jgi:hypothetical protein
VFTDKKEALDYLENCNYPIVTKSNVGSGASKVVIVKSREQAIRMAKKCFSKGHFPYTHRGLVYKRKDCVYNIHFSLPDRRHDQIDYFIVQDYVKDVMHEWRILKVGDNYFGHQKLLKGAQVMLPMRGSENEIFTNEGNRIIFTMNNFSKINNDHDFYVKLEEECGDNVFVGTLKDMGMSHKSSVLTYIFIIIIAIIIIVGFVLYCIWKIKKRIQRGAKLTTSEETKGGNTTVGAKA